MSLSHSSSIGWQSDNQVEVKKKENWGDVVEGLISRQPLCNEKNKERERQLDKAINQIKTSFIQKTSKNSTMSRVKNIQKIEELAKDFYELRSSLSYHPIAIDERPQIALSQQNLVLASMATEINRYDLSSECLNLMGNLPNGVDRYFSQVSLFEYFNSDVGTAIVTEMCTRMDPQEQPVFQETFAHLTTLFKNYLRIMSYIESVKYFIQKSKSFQDPTLWEEIEGKIGALVQSIASQNEDFLVPLGWAFSEGQCGHHSLLLVDVSRGCHQVAMKIFDSALDPLDTLQIDPCVRIDEKSSCEREEMVSIKRPEPLSRRVCGQSCYLHDMDEKIHDIAKVLLLQIPEYTNFFFDNLGVEKGYFSHERKQGFLCQIHEVLVKSDRLLSQKPKLSPLSYWNWFPAPSCAYSSFQSLLQHLAVKTASYRGIDLSDAQEENLKRYFEILLASHKIYLLNNLYAGNDTLKSMFLSAIRASIKESADAIS